MKRLHFNNPLNTGKAFLGKLCKYDHEYEKTGKSLRYVSSKGCVMCAKLRYIKFKEVTKDLLKPTNYDEEKHGECGSLPVFCNEEECISLWKMTFRERIRALIFGKIWLRVLSGTTQPPVSLSVENNVFLKTSFWLV